MRGWGYGLLIAGLVLGIGPVAAAVWAFQTYSIAVQAHPLTWALWLAASAGCCLAGLRLVRRAKA